LIKTGFDFFLKSGGDKVKEWVIRTIVMV